MTTRLRIVLIFFTVLCNLLLLFITLLNVQCNRENVILTDLLLPNANFALLVHVSNNYLCTYKHIYYNLT